MEENSQEEKKIGYEKIRFHKLNIKEIQNGQKDKYVTIVKQHQANISEMSIEET